jgi:hypothetical protein
MQRSEALTPLSHDHHIALEVALRLRRAASPAGDAEAAAGRFVTYMHEGGRRHFAEEETILLAGVPAGDEHADRVRAEHERLLTALGWVEDGLADPACLRAVGELLSDHVRFEERVLFPRLEAELPADRLQAIGEAIADDRR